MGTTAATTTSSSFCCNANPCPNDSNSCWTTYEGTCGDYQAAQANCATTTTAAAAATTTAATTVASCSVTAAGQTKNYGSMDATCCTAIQAIFTGAGSIDANLCLTESVSNTQCWSITSTDFQNLINAGIGGFFTTANQNAINSQCS